jgi:hypothetical protein
VITGTGTSVITGTGTSVITGTGTIVIAGNGIHQLSWDRPDMDGGGQHARPACGD